MTTFDKLPGLVREVVKLLPAEGRPFSADTRVRWGQLMTQAFGWCYEHPEAVEPPVAPAADTLKMFGPLDRTAKTFGDTARAKIDELYAEASEAVVVRAPAEPPSGLDRLIYRDAFPLASRVRDTFGRQEANVVLEDADHDEPFVRRGPLAAGGVIPPGQIVLVGDNGAEHDPIIHPPVLKYGETPEPGRVYMNVQVRPLTEPGGQPDDPIDRLKAAAASPTPPEVFPCDYCHEPFATKYKRAGHQGWCKSRPDAKRFTPVDEPLVLPEDRPGEPVPASQPEPAAVDAPEAQTATGPAERPMTTEERRALVRQEKAEKIIPRWTPPADPHAGARLGHKRTPTQFEEERARAAEAS